MHWIQECIFFCYLHPYIEFINLIKKLHCNDYIISMFLFFVSRYIIDPHDNSVNNEDIGDQRIKVEKGIEDKEKKTHRNV